MPSLLEYCDAEHRAGVIDLWHQCFNELTAHRLPSRSIDMKRAMNDGLFFVAQEADGVVGTVMAGYDGHRGWLYSIAVHPGHRRRGMGEALVRHAEAALARRGCLKVNLQVVGSNADIVPFYTAMGYEIEPHISLGKKLYQRLD